MLIILLGLFVSYVPITILYIYLRNLRKQDEGYRSDCKSLLIKGILCCLGVTALDLVLTIVLNLIGIKDAHPLIKVLIKAFVIAAFAEELVKYLTVNKVIKKNTGNISWLDCIAFTAIVGIGFQLIETVVYLVESNVGQIIVRGILMGHPTYGMLMGYFIGKALYTKKDSFRIQALLWPMLLHGLYDFSLADELMKINDNFVFLPFIILGVGFIIFIRIILLISKERNGGEFTKTL